MMILDESLFQNIVQESSECLKEDYSTDIPRWLLREIEKKEIKTKLLRRDYDLANLKFVRVPKNEIPTNGFNPIFKDTTK